MKNLLKTINIKRKPGGLIHQGLFSFDGKTIPCALGRSGITTQKREGDGATPAGEFKILYGFSRHSCARRQQTTLVINSISQKSGWCDAPTSPNYNQYVELPFHQSHEKMLRDDRLYDVCIVLDYNIHPRKRYAGSAIFFHQTSIGQKPTEGCVAIEPQEMRLLLPRLSTATKMIIHP